MLRLAIPAALVLATNAAVAQTDPLGLQFVTVDHPGNPAYHTANPNDFVNGRGAVDYPYRLGQFEVTTSQWTAFYNAAYDRPTTDRIPFVTTPAIWGAVGTTPNTPGGLRWRVPVGNEMRPVGGISWRTAAIFCNWLCNGAHDSAPRTEFLSGAYDVSTFGFNGNIFTDQAAHTPGAAFYVPTWDEWLKAAHWSPGNPNNNGWYQYSNSSDTPYVYGPPGVGQANAGDINNPNFSLPLGSYPTVQSPWGLFDVAGEATEWTESIRTINTGERARVYDGSWWDESSFEAGLVDQVRNRTGDEYPQIDSHEFGFRIASAVPAPGPCAVGAGVLLYLSGTRRRRFAASAGPGRFIGTYGLLLLTAPAVAQTDPLGLQFVTVDHPGNPAYHTANPNDFVNGRGSVDYTYRIGQYEVTTAQWTSFYNAAFDRPTNDRIPFVATPLQWGAAITTPNTPGGQRWTVPTGHGMWAVGGISWRTAAIFCNWVCNGARDNAPRSDFLSGAYDVSTFGYNGSIFTDQLAHTPGAAYYIPTWDEWLKAAHWSPSNPNNNGWYTYSNGSDTPYVYGPPGVGQANAGFFSPNPFSIPLGSYPGVQSPWGLFDVAGGTKEWTETVHTVSGGDRSRVYDGSYWTDDTFQANGLDQLHNWGDEYPHVSSFDFGLRLASSVPSPPSCALAVGMLSTLGARRRRR